MQDAMIWIQNKILREFPPGGRYLIGVSGGRDSVVLLHQLLDFGYKKLVVCHFNHKLRGRSSEADARFVEQLAARHSLDFAIGSADVRALSSQYKISIETAGREARYRFFASVAKQKRSRKIFLAHQADDLVETFLINLFRGAGMSGLGSIRELSSRKVGNVDLTIVRPILQIWRSDIDKYVRAHRLKFREDASNSDLAPLRNRIRRRVIPYLEKAFGRSIRKNIWRTAIIAAEEENFFEALLPEELDLTALAVAPLRKMPPAIQRRMLRKWLQATAVPNIGFDLIERIRLLLENSNRVAKTNLPQDRHIRRRAGKIFVE